MKQLTEDLAVVRSVSLLHITGLDWNLDLWVKKLTLASSVEWQLFRSCKYKKSTLKNGDSTRLVWFKVWNTEIWVKSLNRVSVTGKRVNASIARVKPLKVWNK